ncbi:phosphoribosyl-AMP cyclohydrolase [bacterium]|nr:MAG: phosphoribosyl-AMP cyclohydrolase [bacterium]
MADMQQLEEGTTAEIDFARLGKFGEKDLAVLPVVLQNADTLEVLYVAYMSEASLRETLATRRVVLWSTSRNKIWRKGETSGDYLDLVEVRVNCEQNSLLVLCRPVQRGCCHTKDAAGQTRATCYYRRVEGDGQGVRLAPVPGKF